MSDSDKIMSESLTIRDDQTSNQFNRDELIALGLGQFYSISLPLSPEDGLVSGHN
jgi:hypothetical protein